MDGAACIGGFSAGVCVCVTGCSARAALHASATATPDIVRMRFIVDLQQFLVNAELAFSAAITKEAMACSERNQRRTHVLATQAHRGGKFRMAGQLVVAPSRRQKR
jgi:hypothetical protein